RELSAHGELRISLLRLGHGDHPGLQRRGRHVYADLDQPFLLLALGDSDRVPALAAHRARRARSVPRDHHRVLDARRGEFPDLPAGTVEGHESLSDRTVFRPRSGAAARIDRPKSLKDHEKYPKGAATFQP